MRKLILIPILFFTVICSAQFTKGGGTFLRTGNGLFVSAPPVVRVNSISVWGAGSVTTIATNGGTLQMLKKTLPVDAADTTATWSVVVGTGTATINSTGLLTATGNGTVNARATANDGSAVYGQREITISNQSIATPAALDTAKVWCYNDISTMTIDGSNRVSIWQNKGTLSTLFFEDDRQANQPIWSNNSLTFNGTSHSLVMLNAAITQPITVYMVVNITSGPNYSGLLKSNGENGGNLVFGASGQIFAQFGEEVESSSSVTNSTWLILRVTLNGASSSIQINNGTVSTGNAGTRGIAVPSIFSSEVAGAIKEFIIIGGGANSDIYDYLKDKHGV